MKRALRCLLRDRTTVQIGLDSPRATVLTGSGAATVIGSLDGTRNRAQVLADACSAGVAREAAERVLDLLSERGLLDDAATDPGPMCELPLAERDRLAPDLATSSLLSGRADAGLSVLDRRQRASVHVHGAGRLGATIASLLAAAGVGSVHPIDPHPARYADTAPAGLGYGDVGGGRGQAAAAALRRTSAPHPHRRRRSPELAVLAPEGGSHLALSDALLHERVPHLLTTVRETTGVVGPLVLPGETACLRCQHLHRADRDPAWPRIAAQLATARGGPGTCAVVFGTIVAAQAASQALSYLEATGEPPPTADGSLELALPGWQWRRRSWPPHPRCGCRWA